MSCKNDMETLRLAFGGRVKQLRLAECLSQEQLGNMVGIERTRLSRIESGKASVSLEIIMLLANGLGVTPSNLLDGFDLQGILSAEELASLNLMEASSVNYDSFGF